MTAPRLILAAAALALTGVACGGSDPDPALNPEARKAALELVDHCAGVARQVYATEGSDFVEFLLSDPEEVVRLTMKEHDLPAWADEEGSRSVCHLAMVEAVTP